MATFFPLTKFLRPPSALDQDWEVVEYEIDHKPFNATCDVEQEDVVNQILEESVIMTHKDMQSQRSSQSQQSSQSQSQSQQSSQSQSQSEMLTPIVLNSPLQDTKMLVHTFTTHLTILGIPIKDTFNLLLFIANRIYSKINVW